MAKADMSLFTDAEKEKIKKQKQQIAIQSSPAIQEQLRKSRVAKDQVAVRAQSRKDNARLESDRQAKLKAREDAKKNTVDYSDAAKPKASGFGSGGAKTRGGKANVSKEQLDKSGLTLTQYMNQWNKSGKRPSTGSAGASKPGTKSDASAKKSFRQKRADRLKSNIADESTSAGKKRRMARRLKRVEGRIEDSKKKPKKMMAGGEARGPRDRGTTTVVRRNMGGGMMKSKMASKGGKMGGKMAGGMKAGGMAKKGYSKGGAVKSSKKRSSGAALKGFGAEMR